MFFYDVPKMTGEKKDLIKSVIKTVVTFAEKARREGILALEDDLDDIDLGEEQVTDLLKVSFSLICDGHDESTIAEFSRYRIATCSAEGDLKLAMMIAANGSLMIQAGDNPRVLATKLLAMTGDFYKELKTEFMEVWS